MKKSVILILILMTSHLMADGARTTPLITTSSDVGTTGQIFQAITDETQRRERELQNSNTQGIFLNDKVAYTFTIDVGTSSNLLPPPTPTPTTIHGKFIHPDGIINNDYFTSSLRAMAQKAGGTLELVRGSYTYTDNFKNGGKTITKTSSLAFRIVNIKKTIDWKMCVGNSDTPGNCIQVAKLTPTTANNFVFQKWNNRKNGVDDDGWNIISSFQKSFTGQTGGLWGGQRVSYTNVYAKSSSFYDFSGGYATHKIKNVIYLSLWGYNYIYGNLNTWRVPNRYDHYWIK